MAKSHHSTIAPSGPLTSEILVDPAAFPRAFRRLPDRGDEPLPDLESLIAYQAKLRREV